ncbi:MAG: hypothetical protein OET90_11550 [Desulfuromonadales bacterium]|nr:hypothetical protein [Desulfuromonadales bacterium]
MLQKIRTNVISGVRPVYLAGLVATMFFAVGLQRMEPQAQQLAHHALYTGLFFCGIWAACHLLADSIKRRLTLEGANSASAGSSIYTFVLYLELVKHVVGVSFTLGWIAGVMFCCEYLGEQMFMVPLTASMAVSLVAFLVTYGISSLVDNLHWPANEQD